MAGSAEGELDAQHACCFIFNTFSIRSLPTGPKNSPAEIILSTKLKIFLKKIPKTVFALNSKRPPLPLVANILGMYGLKGPSQIFSALIQLVKPPFLYHSSMKRTFRANAIRSVPSGGYLSKGSKGYLISRIIFTGLFSPEGRSSF